MSKDLLFQLALSSVPQIGDVQAKILLAAFGTAEDVFRAPRRELERTEGIGKIRAASIKSFSDFSDCESEIRFIEKYDIHPLFYDSPGYPWRLKHCHDAPVMLFYKGNASLNADRILSVVGTRKNTLYGRHTCEAMIEGLSSNGVLIVSGLAFGIDSIAHRAALAANLPTVAVLAHGLDRLYPSQNKPLARKMIEQGGLVTDFRSNTNPDRQHFPRRNRITAGLCDALLVIESGSSGGSLITASIANSYQKDVFAVPGRVNDPKSEGCNKLIAANEAVLVNSHEDILQAMNWDNSTPPREARQTALFHDLTEDESTIVNMLREKNPRHLEELMALRIPGSHLSNTLLSLELAGIISTMPGKMYRLL